MYKYIGILSSETYKQDVKYVSSDKLNINMLDVVKSDSDTAFLIKEFSKYWKHNEPVKRILFVQI